MKYYMVDAFTDALFRGNPAGVCLLNGPLPDGTLQQMAAEHNLSETAFLLPLDGGGYSLRWFTPEQEFDLCGHATLASAFVLFRFVEPDSDLLRFSTQSGELTVARRQDMLEMNFPSRPPKPVPVTPLMEQAAGVPVLEAHQSRDLVLVVESEQQVAQAQPDLSAAAQIPGCNNLILTARGRSADFVSRFFTPGSVIAEDPVTGSAHATLIPFWAERLGKEEMVARQLSRRGGTLYCKHCGERVLIAGKAVLYLSGEIHL